MKAETGGRHRLPLPAPLRGLPLLSPLRTVPFGGTPSGCTLFWDPSGVQSLSRSYPGGIARCRELNHRLTALNPPGSVPIVIPAESARMTVFVSRIELNAGTPLSAGARPEDPLMCTLTVSTRLTVPTTPANIIFLKGIVEAERFCYEMRGTVAVNHGRAAIFQRCHLLGAAKCATIRESN